MRVVRGTVVIYCREWVSALEVLTMRVRCLGGSGVAPRCRATHSKPQVPRHVSKYVPDRWRVPWCMDLYARVCTPGRPPLIEKSR